MTAVVGKGGLSIEGSEFRRNGRRYVMVGANYPSSASGLWGGIWNDYNPEVVDRNLDEIQKAGANSLRAFAGWNDYISPKRGRLNPTPVGRLVDFLKRAAKRDISVQLMVGGVPAWVRVYLSDEGWGDFLPSDVFANPRYRELQSQYLVELIKTAGLMRRTCLAVYDLADEPVWADALDDFRWTASVNNAAARTAWAEWLAGRGEDENTPAPEPHDLLADGPNRRIAKLYQLFVSDTIDSYTAEIREVVKSHDPCALITIGYRCGGINGTLPDNERFHILGLTQDIRLHSGNLDFTSLHFCLTSGSDEDTADAVGFIGAYSCTGKPVVLQELRFPDGGGAPVSSAFSDRLKGCANAPGRDPDCTIVVDHSKYLNPLQIYRSGSRLYGKLRRQGRSPEVILKGEEPRTQQLYELD